jgi:capsular exopolysaccharide synthesis family protein
MLQELATERPIVRTNGSPPRRSLLSAHYEALLQRVLAFSVDTAIGQAFGVTSCAPRAGVSTVAYNLAVTADRAGYGPVLLLDLGTHNSASLIRRKRTAEHGLFDALAGAVDQIDCVVPTSQGSLSVVSARGTNSQDAATIDRSRFAEVLSEFKRNFKLLVVDIPAASETNNSICLASQLDGVLLVIEAERADGRVAQKTKQQLIDANANLLGVVLNKRRQHVPSWLYRRL